MTEGRRIVKNRRVPIRNLFPHEAHDFTKWMAENIDFLCSELELEIKVLGTEIKRDNLRVDLLCEDEFKRTIVIENQLEKADDDHFTRIKRYAQVFEAQIAIWVTSGSFEKYFQAIDELNYSDELTYYYLVTVETLELQETNDATVSFRIVKSPPQHLLENLNSLIVEQEALTISTPRDMWAIFPEKSKKTYETFLQESYVAMTFGRRLGDLSNVEDSKEAFQKRWGKSLGATKARQNTFAAMFHSFARRAKIGDLVIYAPTWMERKIYVGRIRSDYKFVRFSLGYNHRRQVKWIAEFARDEFSKEALRGISVNLAFFKVGRTSFIEQLNEKLENLGIEV